VALPAFSRRCCGAAAAHRLLQQTGGMQFLSHYSAAVGYIKHRRSPKYKALTQG